MPTIPLHPPSPPSRECPIIIDDGAIAQIPELMQKLEADRVAILYDKGVEEMAKTIQKSLPDAVLISVKSGEASKSLDEVSRIANELLKHGVTRKSLIVNVGGGMLTDLGGFVASIYMRGIRFLHVPTSMLGMVDAAIGGKTGVDLGTTKNILGTITHPQAIVIDTACLKTLPAQQLSEGLVEVVKMAAILDEAVFHWLEQHLTHILKRDTNSLIQCIANAAQMKADIVTDDEKEHGARMFLNFGHTVGHAVEAHAKFTIPHGQAVSIGMKAEMQMAKTEGAERVLALLHQLNMPIDLPSNVSLKDLWKLMQHDKKNVRGSVRMAVPVRIGKGEIQAITEKQFLLLGS